MAAPAVTTKDLNEIRESQKKNADAIAALGKNFETFANKMAKTPQGGHPKQADVFGVPWARKGEDSMSSRGFSFIKMFGVLTGQLDKEQAKTECDVHERLHNVYVKSPSPEGQYAYEGRGRMLDPSKKFLAPLATSYMHNEYVPGEFRREMKQLVRAGMDGADHDEMEWIRRKQIEQHYGTKTLSWLDELTGGALVAPPEMGELIELLRNKEALVNAGARTVPLPPQGRMKYPRQTAASLTYWVGESGPITDSNIGTGEVTLQAKKLAVMIKAPNELIRFASPAAEALMRDDMTKSLALALDLACLEGLGGDNRPRGLIHLPDINRIQASPAAQGVDGDRIFGQDIYRMVAAVEESNAEFEGWIMRPKTWFKFLQLRADAVSQNDAQGPFLFNLVRDPGYDGGKPALGGYNVTKSTQVSQARTKGSASNLTYLLGGMFSDCLIGMFGAIEFAATTLGDTAFTYDQTWVRGILSADFNVRHEAAFVMMDQLSTTL
jgi:HK97 family phage major capsid protein